MESKPLSPDEQRHLLTMLEQEIIPPVAEVSKEHKAILKSRPVTALGYRMNFGRLTICINCSYYSHTDSETGLCLKYDHTVRKFTTCNFWRKKRVR